MRETQDLKLMFPVELLPLKPRAGVREGAEGQ